MSTRIARLQDKHYAPVLVVAVCRGVSEAEDGVILTICDTGELADKNPWGSEDAGFLHTVGLSFADTAVLAKALKKAAKK